MCFQNTSGVSPETLKMHVCIYASGQKQGKHIGVPKIRGQKVSKTQVCFQNTSKLAFFDFECTLFRPNSTTLELILGQNLPQGG